MLLILPPSESKRPAPDAGPALDIDSLSFPTLSKMRSRVLDALVATCQLPDAPRRLLVGPSLIEEVGRNVRLRDVPTMRAIDTYAGPLYLGLEASSWPPRVLARAARQVVIVSSLWGALRPADRIPPYRLHVCARLVGMDRLEQTWRSVLPRVLSAAAGSAGPILDLRSRAYQAVGRPEGLDDQTVMLRVRPAANRASHIGDVIAKRTRGQAAAHLLASQAEPEDPLDIASLLAERWPVEVEAPGEGRASWTLTLEADS